MIQRTEFHANYRPPIGVIPEAWTCEPFGAQQKVDSSDGTFHLPVLNVGLGTARYIGFSWHFDLGEFIKALDAVAGALPDGTALEYRRDKGGLLVHYVKAGIGDERFRVRSSHSYQPYHLAEFLRMYDHHEETADLALPTEYVQLVSLLLDLKVGEIPPFFVRMYYRDTGDYPCHQDFGIYPSVRMWANQHSWRAYGWIVPAEEMSRPDDPDPIARNFA